ncbi:LD-carboxypeptidase [Microbacteriaceae bacterium 4G12]
MNKPTALRSGDTVQIIAPASPTNYEKITAMKMKLEGMGLSVVIGKSVLERRGYLAGTDSVRLQDLYEAFLNPNIRAVFCARGGYGSARLLPSLDFPLLSHYPKIFWGYSDITALHIAFQQQSQLITFHGPMMEECGDENIDEETFASFEQLFAPCCISLSATERNVYPAFSYSITAPIVGGNLAVLTSTIGTPYEIQAQGKILFLEEVGEEPYRIDRMLNQLRLAGKLQQCSGVILGDFHECDPKKQTDSLTIPEIMYDYIVPYGIPILSGFPLGHCKPQQGIPLGAHVTMNGAEQTLLFEPGIKT